MATFGEWLRGVGLQQHEALFAAHDVDLDSAPDITDADLVSLGLSLGHRRRFLSAAAALRRVPGSGGPWNTGAVTVAAPAAAAPEGGES